MQIYLLTCEIANMEYTELAFRKAYATEELAMADFEKELDPKHLKGEDAINEWMPIDYDKLCAGGKEFRTGNWGYVIWRIVPMAVIGAEKK